MTDTTLRRINLELTWALDAIANMEISESDNPDRVRLTAMVMAETAAVALVRTKAAP